MLQWARNIFQGQGFCLQALAFKGIRPTRPTLKIGLKAHAKAYTLQTSTPMRPFVQKIRCSWDDDDDADEFASDAMME